MRDKLFQFRLSQKESDLLEKQAKAYGGKKSEYLRDFITGALLDQVQPQDQPSQVAELSPGVLHDLETQMREMENRLTKRIIEMSRHLENLTNISLETQTHMDRLKGAPVFMGTDEEFKKWLAEMRES